MKTAFSLIFSDSSLTSSDLFAETQGPFLFETKAAAQRHLLTYAVSRAMSPEYIDGFTEDMKSPDFDVSEFCGEGEDPNVLGVVTLTESSSEVTSDLVLEWYRNAASREDVAFNFKIQEVPTRSFFEDLQGADSVVIDDYFIRYFFIASADETEDQESTLLEASCACEDGGSLEWLFSVDDVASATFDASTKSWMIGDTSVRPVQVSY